MKPLNLWHHGSATSHKPSCTNCFQSSGITVAALLLLHLGTVHAKAFLNAPRWSELRTSRYGSSHRQFDRQTDSQTDNQAVMTHDVPLSDRQTDSIRHQTSYQTLYSQSVRQPARQTDSRSDEPLVNIEESPFVESEQNNKHDTSIDGSDSPVVSETDKLSASQFNSETDKQSARQMLSSFSSDEDLSQAAFINELKAKILQKMGLTQRPEPQGDFDPSNVTFTREIRKRIKEVMGNLRKSEEEDDDYEEEDIEREEEVGEEHSTITEPSLSAPSVHLPDLGLPTLDGDLINKNLTLLTFTPDLNHPSDPHHELVVKSAILRMRIIMEREALRNLRKFPEKLKLSVFWIRDPTPDHSGQDKKSQLLKTLSLTNPLPSTVDIDVQSVVSVLLEDAEDKGLPMGPITLGAVLHNTNVTLSVVRQKSFPGKSGQVSRNLKKQNRFEKEVKVETSLHIVTKNNDLTKPRVRRSVSRPTNSCVSDFCCRHSLYVSMEDIAWNDWIVAPRGFTAYYCKGQCPIRYKTVSTFTRIKSVLHNRLPDEVPAPVCAPTSYTGLTLIYWADRANHQLGQITYNDLIVARCRCF